MKKILLFIFLMSVSGLAFTSCEEKLDDESVLKLDVTQHSTPLDYWIEHNLLMPYNIDIQYRYNQSESMNAFVLVPADYDKAIMMSKLLKHALIETYVECTSVRFVKEYFPKKFFLFGTPAFNNTGTTIMGVAEEVVKITLLDVNKLDIDNPANTSLFYFQMVFHEFAHILQQRVETPVEFQQISDSKYTGEGWSQAYMTDPAAHLDGFISNYASSEANEDFVELIALYIINTEEWWNRVLFMAGPTGAPIIKNKMEIVMKYLKDHWDMDLKQMRTVFHRRLAEFKTLSRAEILNVQVEE